MYKIEQFITKFFIRAILWLSVICFTIWTVEFSGIVWQAGRFFASLVEVITSLSKNWGPIFGPTAAIIFLISMFKTNLKYEISNDVSRRISSDLKNTVEQIAFRRFRELMISTTIKGIRAVYFGMKQLRWKKDCQIDLARDLSVQRFKSQFADSFIKPRC